MSDTTEEVKVEGTPVEPEDRSLDNTPDKDDSPELAAVKAEDRKQEEIVETSTANAEHAAEEAAKAAGPTEEVKVDGYGEGAAKPKARKPKLDGAAAKASKAGVHIVQAGEELNDIATKYGVGTNTLAELNHLHTGYRALTPGQEIKLYPDVKDATQI